MNSKFAVRTARFVSGERFPILVERESGVPLFDATVFAVSQVRSRNRASATIDQVVRAISVFHLFLLAEEIDFDSRIREGRLLELGEIDSLSDYCCRPLAALNEELQLKLNAKTKVTVNVGSLEKVRLTRKAPLLEIDPESAAVRLRYIREYIKWLAHNRLLKFTRQDSAYPFLLKNTEWVVSAITARLPSDRGRNTQGQREGLTPEGLIRLLEVISPESPENIWGSEHVRVRNELFIICLLSLGVRRGELLGIRIEDINFQKNEIFIARRPDDPTDPRIDKPNTKTRDRILPMDENLSLRLRQHIMGTRRAMVGAREHSVLFVANGTGIPLSLSAATKIFIELRNQIFDLPNDLAAHKLRHTWNDNFSEYVDKLNVSQEREKKMRSYLMGWSEFSGMAGTYTRRHVREAAKKASISLQNDLVQTEKNAK